MYCPRRARIPLSARTSFDTHFENYFMPTQFGLLVNPSRMSP